MDEQDWQPGASLSILRLRAQLLAQVRAFFAQREVLEVDTPLLCRTTATDPHLDSFCVEFAPAEHRFLQTSPEFAMKRLLAAGSGSIFQLCKSFRRDEAGSRHNPEFTMLEWYRPGFSAGQLMDEVELLLQKTVPELLPASTIARISYRALFCQHLAIDPFAASDDELRALAGHHVNVGTMPLSRDESLDLLMSHLIEPRLLAPCFVVDFPASQAALAQITADNCGTPVACRFELFMGGMELANGYLELSDASEQAARFRRDNQIRKDSRLPRIPIDQRLLAALQHGLPDCAGVALGFDRLLMLAADSPHIGQVLAFDVNRV